MRSRAARIGLAVLLAAGALAVARVLVSPRSAPDIVLPDTSAMRPQVVAAILRAREGVVENPGSAAAWGRFGATCHAHRLNAEAATCYRHAWRLEPENFRWPYLLALVLELHGALPREQESLLIAVTECQPDFAPAYARLGQVRLENGRPGEAVHAFEHAVALDRSLATAHRGLGQSMLALNDPEAAIAHLQRATAIVPEDRAAWVGLAQAFARAGRPEAAAQAAARSRQLDRPWVLPDPVMSEVESLGVSPQHAAERGVAMMRAGEYADAIVQLDIVAEVHPADPLTQLYLGTAHAATGHRDLAVEHLRHAISLRETLAEAHVRLASILLEDGDVDGAIDHLRRAPGDRLGLTMLGTVLAGSGRLDEALPVFREIVQRFSDDATARYNLATALMRRGDPAASIPEFHQALRLDPEYADAHYNLGMVLETSGRRDEAVEHYRRAARIDPAHPAARALAELTSRNR